MADKRIQDLEQLEELQSSDLMVVASSADGYDARKVEVREFAETAQKVAFETAQQATQAAQAAQAAAEQAATEAGAAREEAQVAQTATEAAAMVATEYTQLAQTAAEQSQSAAQTAAGAAQVATDAQTAAQTAQDEAEAARDIALTAQWAAETAQTATESARDTTLEAKETAVQSAQTAQEAADTAVQYSGNPAKPINGTWWIWNADVGEYQDTGVKSILSIVKSYPSISDMEADVGNMQDGDLVIIATENPFSLDNSKLYIHDGSKWVFLSDLSGVEGVGVSSFERTSGDGSPGTADVYTLTLTDGRKFEVTVYNGRDGTGVGDMLASVYDPQGRREDVFAYVDDAVASIPMPDVSGQINEHNQSGEAHPDIREDLGEKADRVLGNLESVQTALSNLGAGVRPNLLINPIFVNQRGQNSYSGAIYGPDCVRGSVNTSVSILPSGGIEVSSDQISSISVFFISEIDTKDAGLSLAGQWMTWSVLLEDGRFFTSSGQIPSVVDDFAKLYTDFGGIFINLGSTWGLVGKVFTRQSSIQIKKGGVKLEFGQHQTLAHQLEDGTWELLPQPDMGSTTQLLKCQRYYQLYSSTSARPNSPVDCRPVMRTPDGGNLTQGTIEIDGVTYYYNSAEL